MKLAQTREARAIAVAAASRGFIAPHTVWDAACRWTLGAADSPLDLFIGVLSPEQLAQVVIVPEAPAATAAARPASHGAPPAAEGPVDEIGADDQGPDDGEDIPAAPVAFRETMPPASTSEGRYAFGEELGAGGVGKVVRARDRAIGRVVALKTLKLGPEAPPSVAERFIAEARVAAQLEHPNVVPVYDIGTLPDGQPYYTMRVVKRQSLQDVLGSRDL
ncbi:MAG: protein kinase, partial [Polyangiaceae bacterium]